MIKVLICKFLFVMIALNLEIYIASRLHYNGFLEDSKILLYWHGNGLVRIYVY